MIGEISRTAEFHTYSNARFGMRLAPHIKGAANAANSIWNRHTVLFFRPALLKARLSWS
jgi:hypothetical protein